MALYTENFAAQTDHFDDTFVCEICASNLTFRYMNIPSYGTMYNIRCDDFMTFESVQLTPFCLEKSSLRKMIV